MPSSMNAGASIAWRVAEARGLLGVASGGWKGRLSISEAIACGAVWSWWKGGCVCAIAWSARARGFEDAPFAARFLMVGPYAKACCVDGRTCAYAPEFGVLREACLVVRQGEDTVDSLLLLTSRSKEGIS